MQRQNSEPLHIAWTALGGLAAAKILLHLFAIGHYGYFRDELYYLASTDDLAWGYVDHPPFSIALLAAHTALGIAFATVAIVLILSGSSRANSWPQPTR